MSFQQLPRELLLVEMHHQDHSISAEGWRSGWAVLSGGRGLQEVPGEAQQSPQGPAGCSPCPPRQGQQQPGSRRLKASGLRHHHPPQNTSRSSLQQRGRQQTRADAANRPSMTPFTPPTPFSPKQNTHPKTGGNQAGKTQRSFDNYFKPPLSQEGAGLTPTTSPPAVPELPRAPHPDPVPAAGGLLCAGAAFSSFRTVHISAGISAQSQRQISLR